MWAAEAGGATSWMQVVTELKNRGASDIFIACFDGLGGFPKAIEAASAQTQVQLCMVHTTRRSLSCVSHKGRKAVADDLKAVYQAATLAEDERRPGRFEEAWAGSYAVIARSRRRNRSGVVPMSGYPAGLRRAIYTTNTTESLDMTPREVTKNRSPPPNDEAVFRLTYVALRNIGRRRAMPSGKRGGAMNQFATLFEGRAPMGGLNRNSLTRNAWNLPPCR